MAWAFVVVLGATSACGGGVTDTAPIVTPPTDTTKPPTTVQRASITVRLVVDPADSALARQAGVSVSGVLVRLESGRSGEALRSATTDAGGVARFDGLLDGIYTASPDRPLTPQEIARLNASDQGTQLFGGGASIVLSPPASRTVEVQMVASRRGSLVISEIFGNYGPTIGAYSFGGYVEVYNNADTTVFLDGFVIAQEAPVHSESGLPGFGCSDLPRVRRLDASNVYVLSTMAFPGTGRDYSIRAGEAKVIATDAVNHAAAAPLLDQVDLSRAPFESYFSEGDVDNPESVNMLRLFGSTGGLGRGPSYFSGGKMHILLRPGAVAASTTVETPAGGVRPDLKWTLLRVPRSEVIDVAALEYSPLSFGFENNSAACVPWTSPMHDRAPAALVHYTQKKSITRVGIGRTADGREILQRTGNSSRDFKWADPLQRSLAK
jgi:hypothetical protein